MDHLIKKKSGHFDYPFRKKASDSYTNQFRSTFEKKFFFNFRKKIWECNMYRKNFSYRIVKTQNITERTLK